MIDTIGLNFFGIHIAKCIYENWPDCRHHQKTEKFWVKWWSITEYLANGASFKFTYYPFQNKGLLKIEFSLPHVVFGNNIQMVDNIGYYVDLANRSLPDVPGLPKLDLWKGRLYRLDLCYNFQVANLVPWYIKALQELEFPYRRTRPYTRQGVQYQNDSVVFRIYSKERERRDSNDAIGAQAAFGILRAEIELRRRYIQKLTGSKEPTLQSISEAWAYDTIENELAQLKLLGCSIGTAETTFKTLDSQYGAWEALALIGLLTLKMEYPSTELLAQDADLSPNSIGRHIQKKLVQNGIPPTLTNHTESLPPLVIDRSNFGP